MRWSLAQPFTGIESNIETISQLKAARGTKRACQACSVRFYDLARDPIICPACGAAYVVAPPVVPRETRPVSSSRGNWRSRTAPQPIAVAPVAASEDEAAPEEVAEEAGVPEPDDAIVLEEDADEGELSELIDRPGPEER